MSISGGAYYGVEQVGHLYFFGSALQMAHSTFAMVARSEVWKSLRFSSSIMGIAATDER
jgi:hypothetical protein